MRVKISNGGGSYGYPCDPLPGEPPPGAVYLGKMLHDRREPSWHDLRATEQWLLETLAAQGLEIRNAA